MTAQLLARLGVPMGDDLSPAGEDRAFAFHRGDVLMLREPHDPRRDDYIAAISTTIETRNRTRSLWGWKDPISVLYVPDIFHLLRNPHFVVVTRDPGAVAQREARAGTAAMGSEVHALRQAIELYLRISRLVIQSRAPTIMLSYERALAMPRQAAGGLQTFTGLTTPDFETWAEGFIAKS